MKPKSVVITVITVLAIFVSASNTIAGRGFNEVSDDDPADYILVDKNAPGTKYDGTLTIYYTNASACGFTPPVSYRDMSFFLRLSGNVESGDHHSDPGQEHKSFSGLEHCVPYEEGGINSTEDAVIEQQLALMYFFQSVVNP